MAKKKVKPKTKMVKPSPENKMLKGPVENKAGTWVHSPGILPKGKPNES